MPDEMEGTLSEQDLITIEKANADGLTSAQIIQIFQRRGIRFSEATFRKYVQLGLLPRCIRVGSKGKHRGSHGLYPSTTVRRINSIKGLMRESYTIEEIQRSFSNYKQQIDDIEAALEELFKGFLREMSPPRFDVARSRSLQRDIDEARRTAGSLIRQVQKIESQLVFPEKAFCVAAGGALTRATRQSS